MCLTYYPGSHSFFKVSVGKDLWNPSFSNEMLSILEFTQLELRIKKAAKKTSWGTQLPGSEKVACLIMMAYAPAALIYIMYCIVWTITVAVTNACMCSCTCFCGSPSKRQLCEELDGSDEFFLCVDESKVICSLSNNRHVAFAILSMLNRVTAALYFTETILNPYTYKFIYMYQLVFSSRHYIVTRR